MEGKISELESSAAGRKLSQQHGGFIKGNTPQLTLQRGSGPQEKVSRLFPASLQVSAKNNGSKNVIHSMTLYRKPITMLGVWLGFKYLQIVNVSLV